MCDSEASTEAYHDPSPQFYSNCVDDEIENRNEDQQNGMIPISDRVHSLANSIYKEFESMIDRYGNEVVEKLMPLVVGMLEGMDQLYADRHNLEIDLELLKEDNAQVLAQYEREKTQRKLAEENSLQIEDIKDEEKRKLSDKVESLESLLRIMELKSRNYQEQVSRLEEKELEQKREYSQLHDRYTELFRSHMDYIERTKNVVLQQGPPNLGGSEGSSLDGAHNVMTNKGHGGFTRNILRRSRRRGEGPTTEGDSHMNGQEMREEDEQEEDNRKNNGKSLNYELDNWNPQEIKETSRKTSGNDHSNDQPITNSNRPIDEFEVSMSPIINGIDSSVFPDEGADFDDLLCPEDTGSIDDYGETVQDSASWDNQSDDFGVGREIENLIRENSELIETKNALNIVKDDLIVKLDDLTGENMIFREEVNSLTILKTSHKERICELEKESKMLKEQISKLQRRLKELDDGEEDQDESQGSETVTKKTRFTRSEMARVLMERNSYKEQLMELRDQIRWTEAQRLKKEEMLHQQQEDDWPPIFKQLFWGTSTEGYAPPMESLEIGTELVINTEGSVPLAPVASNSDQPETKVTSSVTAETVEQPSPRETDQAISDNTKSTNGNVEATKHVQRRQRGSMWNYFSNLIWDTVAPDSTTSPASHHNLPPRVTRPLSPSSSQRNQSARQSSLHTNQSARQSSLHTNKMAQTQQRISLLHPPPSSLNPLTPNFPTIRRTPGSAHRLPHELLTSGSSTNGIPQRKRNSNSNALLSLASETGDDAAPIVGESQVRLVPCEVRLVPVGGTKTPPGEAEKNCETTSNKAE